jgi:hypothetical protein
VELDGGRVVQKPNWKDVDFNLCNANARALLGLLGLPDDDLCGGCTMAEANRAVMKAEATFASRVASYTRPDEVVFGQPRANEDGTIEMRPVRAYGQGLSEDDLAIRLTRFKVFLAEAANLGADMISWG